MTPELLGIIGAFLALGLSVNAYFIKQLVDSINQVKIQTAVLINSGTYAEKRINKLEENEREIFMRLHKIERH
jgi:hypothetical protein